MERQKESRAKDREKHAKGQGAQDVFDVTDGELEKKMEDEKAQDEKRKNERRATFRREADRVAHEERESALQENTRLKEEIESMKDAMIRRQADFENYKKRAAKLQGEIRRMAIRDFACEIIQIHDDLLRAVEASENMTGGVSVEESHRSFVEGVSMISRRIEEAMQKFGITEIEAMEREFDPNLHEAVEIERSDGVDRDTVVHVYQKGFRIDDLVVRSSRVRVAKPTKAGVPPPGEETAGNDTPQ